MPDDLQRFGPIEIRAGERRLLVDGRPAPLGARAFDVLMALVERRDRVVPKRELLEVAWPGLIVEENNLQVQISSLRKVLGQGSIATVPGRGYRFTLPSAVPEATPQPPAAAPAARAAADAAAPAGPGNLPAVPRLFGRDDDLAQVHELMRACPVVSIVGAGGIGKTRLAMAAAATAPVDAPDGRWWAELGALTDGAEVVPMLAGLLGVSLIPGREAADALGTVLMRQRLLLVLDNCEHLADAVAKLVGRLRAVAPGVRLLLTSQESLKCADEQVYRLGALTLPDSDEYDVVRNAGAATLFATRAHAVDPRFRLTAENAAAVADICRRLDGIPLALELAAARVPMLGVSGLRTRLDHMFNVLTGASRMRLRRHQTLRAALEWSHGLLDDDERAVFRRLAVFAGGFPLEWAQDVATDERIDRWQALDILAQLIDKSLVLAEGGDVPRYRLLEPTRAYALERLGDSFEWTTLLRRHAEVVCRAMEQMEARRWTQPFRERLQQLGELGNLRAAIDWAMGADGDRLLAIRLLAHSWFIFHGNEAAHDGHARMQKVLPLPAGLPVELEARFWLALASLRIDLRAEQTLHAARRAVELHRALNDVERLGDALCRLVIIAQVHRGAALDLVDPAMAEAAACIGPQATLRQRALLAMVEGVVAIDRSDFPAARAAYEKQAGLYRESGSELGVFLARINIANVLLDEGEVEAAVDLLQRCIAGIEAMGEKYGLSLARNTLTVALAVHGSGGDVPRLARQSFETALPTGDVWRPLMAIALHQARSGDARRAAVVSGYARQNHAQQRVEACRIDDLMKQRLTELLEPTLGPDVIEELSRRGEALRLEDAAAIAFDEAPLPERVRAVEPAGA